MSFWKYILVNRLWLLLAFYGVSAFFIWYWVRFQEDYERDIKITVGLNVLVTIGFIGGNYYKWKQLRR